mgnify:CR=1 FL=1
MGKGSYHDARRSNIPNQQQRKDGINKVNNGVFVFTRQMSTAELSKELNIPTSDIMKFLFLNKKMVNLNTTLDDDTIGLICLEFGYDFRKEKELRSDNGRLPARNIYGSTRHRNRNSCKNSNPRIASGKRTDRNLDDNYIHTCVCSCNPGNG